MKNAVSVIDALHLNAQSGVVVGERVVLQKMGSDIKGLTRTPTYATIMNRFDTNLTCPRMSPLPTPSICPFLMMFIVSYPLIVRRAVLKLKKPSPGLTRRFMNRWSCSSILFSYHRYLHSFPTANTP